MNKKSMSARTIALCSVMTALVVILQFMGAFLRFGPFSVSLVLIPIVLGAAMCGVWAGAWLGFCFGAVVLLSGDAAAFLQINAIGTIVTVLLKGIACGALAGLAYKLVVKYSHRHSRYLAVVYAAFICPIVNTGIFLIGCRVFFWDTILLWTAEYGFENAARYVIFGLVGANFIFEMAQNMILSPIVVRLLNIRKKR